MLVSNSKNLAHFTYCKIRGTNGRVEHLQCKPRWGRNTNGLYYKHMCIMYLCIYMQGRLRDSGIWVPFTYECGLQGSIHYLVIHIYGGQVVPSGVISFRESISISKSNWQWPKRARGNEGYGSLEQGLGCWIWD
jgi:hypothetical protein